jgi:Rieske Fe-S protein
MAIEPVTRRSALRGVGIGAVGAVAGFVVAKSSDAAEAVPAGAANGYGPEKKGAAAGSGELARVDQVPEGGGIVLQQQTIVLTRDADGTVHAFSATCPHQGCPVSTVANGTIDCPCHGSRFDAKTGAVVAGPAPRGLTPVTVVVHDGGVFRS